MCVCVPHLYPIYNNRGFVINFANLSLCHINLFSIPPLTASSQPSFSNLSPRFISFGFSSSSPYRYSDFSQSFPFFFGYFSPPIFFLSHIIVTLLPTFLPTLPLFFWLFFSPIIPHLTVTIPPTIPLHLLLFFSHLLFYKFFYYFLYTSLSFQPCFAYKTR